MKISYTHRLLESALQQYRYRDTDVERQLLSTVVWATLTKRQQYAIHTRYGQKQILWKIKQLCTKSD